MSLSSTTIEYHDPGKHGWWTGPEWARVRYTADGFMYSEYRGADGVWRKSKIVWDRIIELRSLLA